MAKATKQQATTFEYSIKEEGKSPRKKGEVANTVFAIVQQKTRIYKEARSTEQEHG